MNKHTNKREGKVLMLVGLLMTVFLGMVALAVDLGWILMTKTQLQSASDAGSLAGGTELLPGLGASAFRTPAEVKALANIQAVQFVAKHPAGNAPSAYIDAARDVQFGTAALDTKTGAWAFTWGAVPYNAVGVTTRRSDVGTTDGDGPLPLIFARALGRNFANVTTTSVAVILPASGIRIPPDSEFNSRLSPFAFDRARWEKYWRARKYIEDHGMVAADLTIANGGHEIMDVEDGTPLFYELIKTGNSEEPRILFDDQFATVDPIRQDPDNIINKADGVLEINIYPIVSESGNFGTVDIGGLDNSTSDIGRQIQYGLSNKDLADFPNQSIKPTPEATVFLQGDTGISAGLQAAIENAVGQCRGILLYTDVQSPGNNATYEIDELVGTRFMKVDLTGKFKTLIIQPCSISDPAGIPNYDEEIGDETTFFSPLILAN